MNGNDFEYDRAGDIERAIRYRAGPEPTAKLRERVMSGVDAALSNTNARPLRRWNPVSDLVGWAAVLVVGLALSQITSSATAFFARPTTTPTAGEVRAAADLLRQADPNLTRDEADRLTLASAWPGALLPLPIANDQPNSARAESRPPPGGEIR